MAIERRRRLWYVTLDIPKDVRGAIGKRRFVRSLGTEHKGDAKRRALLIEAGWRREIEAARGSAGLDRDGEFWARIIPQAPADQRPQLIEALHDEAHERVLVAAMRDGIHDYNHPAFDSHPEHAAAKRMIAVGTGQSVRLDAYVDEFMTRVDDAPKTALLRRGVLKRWAERFTYTGDLDRASAQKFLNEQAEVKSSKSIARDLTLFRGYWRYLASLGLAQDDPSPLDKVTVPKGATRNGHVAPFDPADVVKLLKCARAKGDAAVADLIELGRWTGARIGELGKLRVEDVDLKRGFFRVKPEDAKTAASVREVPIHSQLRPIVERLVAASKDGYVLPGSAEAKVSGRHDMLGKRFGRLKTDAGFKGREYCFHSIRKTVATAMENAGVPEGVTADILGHEKQTMTYGLYSGGNGLEVKREALEKLSYPAD